MRLRPIREFVLIGTLNVVLVVLLTTSVFWFLGGPLRVYLFFLVEVMFLWGGAIALQAYMHRRAGHS